MRTVTYASVIDRISGYLGENGGMSVEDAGLCNRLLNVRYRGAYEYYMWPDFLAIEQRQFRPSWDPTVAYSASTSTGAVEVYYYPANQYYQCLTASTGQTPTTGTPPLENSAYWAESRSTYSGQDWVTGTAYSVGTQVRYPLDGRYYQCTVAHTAGGTIDGTKFGILTRFVRSLVYEQPNLPPFGEIKKIWDRDPDANTDAREMPFTLRSGFILVRGLEQRPWVEYRQRPVSFTGPDWAAGSYAPGDQVYYDTTGNYYTCIASASTQDPTNTAFWSPLPVPYIFAEYLAQSVYAALMAKEEEMPEDFSVELSAGWPLLQLELQKIERQQGQTRQLRVVGRGRGGRSRCGW